VTIRNVMSGRIPRKALAVVVVVVVLVVLFLGWQLSRQTIFAKAVVLSFIPARPAPVVEGLNVVVPDFEALHWGTVRDHVAAHCPITDEGVDGVLSLATCLRTLVEGRRTNQNSVLALDYLEFFEEELAGSAGEPVACATYVSLLGTALTAHGCHVRRIDLLDTRMLESPIRKLASNFRQSSDNSVFDRHQALEYFDTDRQQWIFVDGWYGMAFRGQDGEYLSAWDLQDAWAVPRILRFHNHHRPYGWEEYASYFGQIAFGKNWDPTREFEVLHDEYGAAYRAYDIRLRNDSPLLRKLTWTFQDSHDAETEAAIHSYMVQQDQDCSLEPSSPLAAGLYPVPE
jgi:hypothetical protein